MSAPVPVMELKDVGFYYTLRRGLFARERLWALDSISFTLNKGESLGVIGRNGAGKSTLMRLMGGIVKPDRGQLINHGYTPTLLSLQAGFTPYLTGRENTILSGLMLGFSKRDIRAAMDEIKAFSELGEFFDLPISSYSTGMRARLGFSIALQLDPDVLLLDEVMGVGDENFREKSTQRMVEKIRSETTIVLVSHIPAVIEELCDRAVLIEDGRTQIEGSTAEVLDAYRQVLRKAPPGHWQLLGRTPGVGPQGDPPPATSPPGAA